MLLALYAKACWVKLFSRRHFEIGCAVRTVISKLIFLEKNISECRCESFFNLCRCFSMYRIEIRKEISNKFQLFKNTIFQKYVLQSQNVNDTVY